jgi:ankyrin repeat protein
VDLEQARRRAKELLRAARAGDPAALARLRDDRAPRLTDAQRAVANDLGFSSWPALVSHVEALRGDRAKLVHAALSGRANVAERILALHPEIAGLDVALVLGDVDTVRTALERDPGLVGRELPGPGRKPLSCACHSDFLRPASSRVDGVRAVVRLLLDHGADVDETHTNEFGAMSVLYGAAGVANDPVTTLELLERGANPDDGESVYHATEAPDPECLRLLLTHGATVRHTNALGLALAWPERVRMLLELGDVRPEDASEVLPYAAAPETVRLLLAHGADVDARDRYGLTLYQRSARFKSPETMRVLAEAGADTTLDPAAEWLGAIVRGETEHAARVKAEHPDLVLSHDDAEDLPRWASAGDDVTVGRLLDAGVPIDAPGVDDGTALHYAAMWGKSSTVRLLLDRGAEVDAKAGVEGTPLAWLAWGSRRLGDAEERVDGHLAAAEVLVEAGAEVTAHIVELAGDEISVRLQEQLDNKRTPRRA